MLSRQDAPDIVATLGKTPPERLEYSTDTPFFMRQHKIVLEHCGQVDPERIEDSIAHGGYFALVKASSRAMTPQGVIETITKSGLRGRGGAGFPDRLEVGDRGKVGCAGPRGSRLDRGADALYGVQRRRRRPRRVYGSQRDGRQPGWLNVPLIRMDDYTVHSTLPLRLILAGRLINQALI